MYEAGDVCIGDIGFSSTPTTKLKIHVMIMDTHRYTHRNGGLARSCEVHFGFENIGLNAF
jgi:hypothetical protein